MIVTKQKSLEVILKALDTYKNVFIIGCADCATTCSTGGEKEVAEMKALLEEKGYRVTGTGVIDVPCDERQDKVFFRKNIKEVENSDAVLVLACGSGVNTIVNVTDKHVITGLDSQFLGSVERLGIFHEYCSTCGDCVLNETNGICPVTRCAKNLVNGPCGGAVNGKCEVAGEQDCFWVSVYHKNHHPGALEKILPARRNSRSDRPNSVNNKL